MRGIGSKIPIDENEYQHEYGMSFADLMSTLVGTFLILLMFFMYQNTSQTEQIVTMHKQQINNLKESEKKVENILVIREDLIKKLKETFDSSNLNVTIDYETGAIRFSDKIFFDYNSDVISAKGKQFLNQFIPKYISTILNEKTRANLSEIIIEGHTDNKGSYMYNLDLSQRRALAVSKYIFSSEMPNFKEKTLIKDYLTSTGKSFSKLLYKNSIVDQESSRRVEFKFRLKEDEAMQEIQQILSE